MIFILNVVKKLFELALLVVVAIDFFTDSIALAVKRDGISLVLDVHNADQIVDLQGGEGYGGVAAHEVGHDIGAGKGKHFARFVNSARGINKDVQF